jgi:hypothetical protein
MLIGATNFFQGTGKAKKRIEGIWVTDLQFLVESSEKLTLRYKE